MKALQSTMHSRYAYSLPLKRRPPQLPPAPVVIAKFLERTIKKNARSHIGDLPNPIVGILELLLSVIVGPEVDIAIIRRLGHVKIW